MLQIHEFEDVLNVLNFHSFLSDNLSIIDSMPNDTVSDGHGNCIVAPIPTMVDLSSLENQRGITKSFAKLANKLHLARIHDTI